MKLRPCPFCNSRAALAYEKVAGVLFCFVQCRQCNASGGKMLAPVMPGAGHSEAAARENWNLRHCRCIGCLSREELHALGVEAERENEEQRHELRARKP